MKDRQVKFIKREKGLSNEYEGKVIDKIILHSNTYYLIETKDGNLHHILPTNIIKII